MTRPRPRAAAFLTLIGLAATLTALATTIR